MNRKIWVLIGVTLLLLTSTGVGLTAANPVLERQVLGGGGGRVQASGYVLHGAFGQAVTGRVSQASYDLCTGFWCGIGADNGGEEPTYELYLPLMVRG